MLRHSVVITSYDIVRNDIEFLGGLSWNYLVLDEGHVIKNTKSKTSQAIRKLTAQHRLILSGTPIQNSVVELWSLFDFLMPGYLGSEKQFMHRYARPILASRDGKCSLKEQEAGVLPWRPSTGRPSPSSSAGSRRTSSRTCPRRSLRTTTATSRPSRLRDDNFFSGRTTKRWGWLTLNGQRGKTKFDETKS